MPPAETVIRNGYEYTWDGLEYVAARREAYFNSDRGKAAQQKCYWCAKALSSYGSKATAVVIDHIDNDRLNNDPENLGASCRDCNLLRGKLDTWVAKMPPYRFKQLIEITEKNWENAPE